MAGYDPFARGPFPAGVVTAQLERDGRALPVELWYPASEGYAELDLNDATRDTYEILPGLPAVTQDAVRDATPRSGRFPLVVFSHGYGGHRRQSTFLCTHLAPPRSVVAAVEHTGNTVLDVMATLQARQSGRGTPEPDAVLRQFVAARPADVVFTIDRVLAGEGDLASHVDPARIGMAGHSFGGWTTLVVTAREARIRATLALAPAGGASPLPVRVLRESLEVAPDRAVPTLVIVAERDTLLPLAGMRELVERTCANARLVVLKNADHMHFCDRVEEVHEIFRLMPHDPLFEPIQKAILPITELCPGEHGHLATRGLGLAHMDAYLKASAEAQRFLGGDLRAALAERGVAVDVLPA